MKKSLLGLVVLITLTLMIAPSTFAKGGGPCYHGQDFGERTCYNYENAGSDAQGYGTCQLIETGTPMEITGVVSEIGLQGQGLKVDTGDGIVTVYGMGPIRYWTESGIDRPTVGEEVLINAVEVTFSDGSKKIIALDITMMVDGERIETIDLRDDSGLPLWRGSNAHRFQNREALQ